MEGMHEPDLGLLRHEVAGSVAVNRIESGGLTAGTWILAGDHRIDRYMQYAFVR